MRSIEGLSEEELLKQLIDFANSKRLLRYSTIDVLANTVSILYRIVLLSDKNMPIKAYLDIVRQIQDSQGNTNCFEDEFVLALAFLGLEVIKLGAVTYLKGESPDFKQTKRKIKLLNIEDDGELKNISAVLTRPNEERGSVEVTMIEASQKKIAKLIDIQNVLPHFAKLVENGATKTQILRTLKVGALQENITSTDYDIISRMARREGIVALSKSKKDPENRYELRTVNHERVKKIAERLGITPRRALNKILDDFFDMQERSNKSR